MENKLKIRKAERKDCIRLYNLMVEFSKYIKLENEFNLEIESLEKELFDNNSATALIVENDDELIGYALYFTYFSSFNGKNGIHLDDLFIKSSYRNRGCGKALLKELSQIALRENYFRIKWTCKKWNIKAKEFYSQLGAKLYDESVIFNLDEESMKVVIKDIL